MFPAMRMRRLRKSQQLRDLFSETQIDHGKLIMPVFVEEGLAGKEEIRSMPGIFRHSLQSLENYVKELEQIGLKSVIIFGIPEHKDAEGTSSHDDNGIVQQAIRMVKKSTNLNVMADLCLCEYTDHGHCGIIVDGEVENDSTLSVYGKIAVSYARAGVDMVAPSGMMDGQVQAIRDALDSEGFENTPIMAYAAKFHTSLYGPFREAVDSTPGFGDRRSYQMDFRNSREALREIEEDALEGADVLMVKPSLFYLDIIALARSNFDHPIAAYNVSGEYTMIMNAVQNGLLNEDAIEESITSIFRAGADMVITYFAEYILKKRKLQ